MATLIIVWHGSSKPQWSEVAQAARTYMAQHIDAPIITASVADFNTKLMDSVASGERNIVVLPLFIAPGAHIFDDVDGAIDACIASHPDVSITRKPTLLEMPVILDALVGEVQRRSPTET